MVDLQGNYFRLAVVLSLLPLPFRLGFESNSVIGLASK
jgi:hypothetical protein